MLAFGHTPLGERIARRLSKAVGVPPTGIDWRVVERPAYANQVGTIVLEGDHVRVRVEAVEGDWGSPRLATAFERVLC
jgi:hypothetical protein